MALATQCPHCHTTFRVASDQLKLRGGIVRCGACQRIFDGSAHLIDLEALAARKAHEAAGTPAAEPAVPPAPALPEPAMPEPVPSAPEPAGDADDSANPPVYTLDFDHTFDPFGILPKVEPTLDAAPAPQPADAVDVEAGPDDQVDQADEAADDLPPVPDIQAQAEPQPVPERAPVPAHAYAPAGRIEPGFDLPVDEELVAQPLPDQDAELEPEAEPEHEPVSAADTAPEQDSGEAPPQPASASPAQNTDIPSAALPLRASADLDAPSRAPFGDAAPTAPRSARAKSIEARARRSKMTPTRIEPPKLRMPRMPAEPDEPEFVKRSRRQERSGKTVRILMSVGVAILLLLLAAQLLLTFRNELAVRQPAMRPLLSGLCALAGCRVGLPAQAENLVIEDGELSTLAPDTYSLNTQLRNQSSLPLAWPSIELELTDANNKPLLRRVFGPADYLPPSTPVAAGFGAHAEQPVRLNFALADLKPSGYHTFVFYP